MGEILNRNIQLVGLPADHRRSFAGAPKKVLLPGGTVLFRFVTYADEHTRPSNQDRPVSPFWLPKATCEELDRLHRETDIPMAELVRGTAAVAFDFKGAISGIMRARLRRETYAFRGTIAAQPMLGSGGKALTQDRPRTLREVSAPGGLEQVYIPDLKESDLYDIKFERLSPRGSARFLFDQV